MGDVSLIAPVEASAVPAPIVDTGAREAIEAVEKRLKSLERALARVAKSQNKNLPIFEEAIQRIATMRETLHAHAQGLSRVEKIATDSATVTGALAESVRVITASQQANGDKLDEILSLFTHAKTWTGYARRFAPKLLPFALGIAVAKGWITAEHGKNFLSIFGL